MLKLLLTLGIIVLALMWWFGKGRGRSVPPPDGRHPARPARMVACAHCGLHLPQADAVEGESGRLYCGVEHRRLGPASER